MSNFVFYDFETSSSNKQWGQIIEIGAILTDDELNELDRFESKCRLSPGIIPEAMSLIVSNTTPKRLKETNLSHYQMVRQFVEKLKSWSKVTYVGWNNLNFDQLFWRNTLFQNLEYPFTSTTNGNKEGDLINLARAANLYYPNTLKNRTNEKGNLEYKLDTIAPLNGIEHAAHTAIGDCLATLEIAKIIKKKAPSVWEASLLTANKDESLKTIKNEKLFCTNEFYYGKVVPFVQTFVCQHPVYQWPKTFDLKQDPNIYMNMPIQVLKGELKKPPKVLRTCRHNKHPIIMNPSYIDNFEEYKMIGITKLTERANIVRQNKKFAELFDLFAIRIVTKKIDEVDAYYINLDSSKIAITLESFNPFSISTNALSDAIDIIYLQANSIIDLAGLGYPDTLSTFSIELPPNSQIETNSIYGQLSGKIGNFNKNVMVEAINIDKNTLNYTKSIDNEFQFLELK